LIQIKANGAAAAQRDASSNPQRNIPHERHQPGPSFDSGQGHIKPFNVAIAIFRVVVAVSLFFTGLPR